MALRELSVTKMVFDLDLRASVLGREGRSSWDPVGEHCPGEGVLGEKGSGRARDPAGSLQKPRWGKPWDLHRVGRTLAVQRYWGPGCRLGHWAQKTAFPSTCLWGPRTTYFEHSWEKGTGGQEGHFAVRD